MGLIRKLDPHLVNQIAAGEVVERPASVVKELLENSIDAQTSRVDIAVEEGGKKLVRVQDDGAGISAEDLPLAVTSHATSKIGDADDLQRIATLGFRGEALPSIGSISRMTVTSRESDRIEGHGITVEAGQAGSVQVAGTSPGTTVEVRNLFQNVPARRKFLKTDATELGHVVEAAARVALAYPQVALRLSHNGRVVHDLPTTESLRDRVGALFGRALAEKLIKVETRGPAGELRGLVAPPSESRASSRMLYLFINGRYVRDRSLLHAVREAYRGLVEANRQPIVFLYLTVPYEDIDANVHPTKVEVRLRKGQQLYRELLAALRERFLSADLAPRVGIPSAPGVDGDASEQRKQRVRQSVAEFFRMQPGTNRERVLNRPSQPSGGGERPTPEASPGREAVPSNEEEAPTEQEESPSRGEQAPPDRGFFHAIQLHNTYLVAESEEGMLIVDQHALHERVLYEDLRRRIRAGALESQRLLIPDVVEVTETERAFLEAHRKGLAGLGIEFEWFGARSVGIQAFPSILGDRARPGRVLRDLLDWAEEYNGEPEVENVLDQLLHRMACRAAVKAGDVLSQEEIESLLAKRHLADRQTATCPHGRPTSLVLTRSEIERQFKRDYPTTRARPNDEL